MPHSLQAHPANHNSGTACALASMAPLQTYNDDPLQSVQPLRNSHDNRVVIMFSPED
jgi:hypothetical protein